MSSISWGDVARLAGLRFRGSAGEVRCHCPWHEDAHPSASLNLDSGLICCYRCARGARVDKLEGVPVALRHLQLPPAERGAPVLREAPSTERAEAVYVYRDAAGTPVFRVVRERVGESKRFSQQPYVAGRGWCVGSGCMRGVNRVLYRLPELLASTGVVVHVEGEKCVERLEREGIVATTSPGGASGWRDEYVVHLRGRSVVILPDHDAPGHQYAAQVLASVSRVGRARVVELPGLEPGEDVVDWLDTHTADELRREVGC